MTLVRFPLRLICMAVVLLLAMLGSAAPLPAAVAQAQKIPRILVLRGGDAASDEAVLQALRERAFDVVSGPETSAFVGAKDELRNIDVVVVLYNANWNVPLTPAGLSALDRFVRKGGGLVAAGWALLHDELVPLLPATPCGWNVASSTTYTLEAPNPSVSVGVPASFEFALANFAGSEACLIPRDDATVLYSSSNGGGRGGAGLVAWNLELGRAAAFSTLISATELQSSAYKTLFQNTVAWLAKTRDTTPPKLKSLTVSGANGFVDTRAVQIELKASDQGGSGLGSYYLRESHYSGNPADGWVEVANSGGWQPYQQPSTSFSWTLGEQPGVHYLQLFVADRAGNVVREPGVVFVNYRPAQVPIALDGLHIYRVAPAAGSSATVRMDVRGGNPDLYVFGPGVSFTPEGDGLIEQMNFLAQGGVYQIEVAGFQAGSYSLSLTASVNPNSTPPSDATIQRRPRISVTAITPAEPAQNSGALPSAPVDPDAAALFEALYLPLLRR